MQVEVCVQDVFAESDGSEDAETQYSKVVSSDCSISVETWEEWFQKWLEVLQPTLSPIASYELSLRLTDDQEIQVLNSQYRQQDKPTDVLAFAALESAAPQLDEIQSSLPLNLGDVVISVDTAKQQAKAQEHPLAIELAWLAAHGLLHLLGWDHPDDESLVRMLNQQQVLLNTVGLMIETR